MYPKLTTLSRPYITGLENNILTVRQPVDCICFSMNRKKATIHIVFVELLIRADTTLRG